MMVVNLTGRQHNNTLRQTLPRLVRILLFLIFHTFPRSPSPSPPLLLLFISRVLPPLRLFSFSSFLFAQELFDSYDEDNSGELGFDEFVTGVMEDSITAMGSAGAATTARYYRCADFKVGAHLQFMFPTNGYMTQSFEILSADKYTKQLMVKDPGLFPQVR